MKTSRDSHNKEDDTDRDAGIIILKVCTEEDIDGCRDDNQCRNTQERDGNAGMIPEQSREGKRTCLRLFISAPEERFIALATLTPGHHHHVTTHYPPVLLALACESYYSVSQVWQDSQPQTAQSSPL